MKFADSIVSDFTKATCFALAVLLFPLLGVSQEKSENDTTGFYEVPSTYFGFSPGIGLFTRSAEGGVPGKTFHKVNFNGGLTLLSGDIEKFTFKTGLEFNFFRSSYISDTSYYEEFFTIPFLFQVESAFREGGDRYFTIHIGPAISLSAGNGYAGPLDDYYIKDEPGFLDYAKISGLAEFALYSKQHDGINAFGLRLSADIGTGEARPGWELKPQRYLMATIFASFMIGGNE